MREDLFMLSLFLTAYGANPKEITDIYILGYSISPPDLEYFAFLMYASRVPRPEATDQEPEATEICDPLENLNARIQ